VHKLKLIIYNLQSQKSGFGVSRTMKGHPSQRLPSCLQGHQAQLHRSIHSACLLEKNWERKKHAYYHKSWEKIKGRKIKLLRLRHVFALYSLPIIFPQKNFSLATLARLPFILHLKNATMQCAFTNPIYIYIFWCHYPWLSASKIHWKHA